MDDSSRECPFEAWQCRTPDYQQQFDDWYGPLSRSESYRVRLWALEQIDDIEGNARCGCPTAPQFLRYATHVNDVAGDRVARYPKAPWR